MSEFKALLAATFQPYAELTPSQLDLLEAHYNLLVRWNSKINLTRITDLHHAVELHYCESLFLALSLPSGPLKIADIGSGAGFPGFPIAVFRPDCRVDLIESHQRKAVFLREGSVPMPKVHVVASRAEDVTGHYDWAVSRAVTPKDVVAAGLADHFAILGGADLMTDFPDWQILSVPWGSGRFLITK